MLRTVLLLGLVLELGVVLRLGLGYEQFHLKYDELCSVPSAVTERQYNDDPRDLFQLDGTLRIIVMSLQSLKHRWTRA